MNKSETLGQLAAALSRFQGEVQDASKDKKAHNYKYADLAQILEIVRPLLAKNKLAISQLPGAASEKLTLETILMHESGEWISSVIEMKVEPSKSMNLAQACGSVISYARRYALSAICGIAQQDDDAGGAKEPQSKPAVIPVLHSLAMIEQMVAVKMEPEKLNEFLAKKGYSGLSELSQSELNKFGEYLKGL